MAWRSSWMLALGAALALAGGWLLTESDAVALYPPMEHTVLSRATLLDPIDIAVAGPSDLEVAQLTIEPGGTTGARRSAGPTLVSVVSGTASRYQVEDGSCRTTNVLPGVAYFVAPGQVDEVRNHGPLPLHLQTTSLAPAGEKSASSAPATSRCVTPSSSGLSFAVLTRSTIPGPVRITTDGPSDIVTSRVVFQRGASSGWHSHPGGMLVSVDEGQLHWVVAKGGRCTRRESPAGTGYWELPDPGAEVHDYRNDGAGPATFHYVGFSSSRGPLVGPRAPAPECTALTQG